MPFTPYANQKTIRIHKPKVDRNFLQIPNADWMAINKTLGPYGLQLYLYLAANADGYSLNLSPQNAENDAGIRRTTFYEYMKKLEIHGYLVWKKSNVYDFLPLPVLRMSVRTPTIIMTASRLSQIRLANLLLAVNPLPGHAVRQKIYPIRNANQSVLPAT